MRPSGTEPKIKFYFSVNGAVDGGDAGNTAETLRKKLDGFKKDLNARVSAV
jgi:phosphomannomutase